MRNLKAVIEYDGTAYGGWQRQKNAISVQQVIEEVLEKMTGVATCLRGAGRTDSGVHARGQVANFLTEAKIPTLGFQRGMNSLLPVDITIVSLEEVDASFDARKSARGKQYTYRIWNREPRSSLLYRFTWSFYRPLDLDRMREAASHLVGEHDFTAFRAADCDRKNPVRRIDRLEIHRGDPDPLIVIDVEGTAFLKHMVRIIAGTLVEVGCGSLPPSSIPSILSSRDRKRAGKTAPSRGLTLERVIY